jgi:O-antigen/teichoic acid export membrane protein
MIPVPPTQPSGRALLRALGTSGGGDLLAKAAVLLTSVIAARLLEPAAFAVYVAVLAVALVAAAVWDMGISTLVTTNAARGAPRGAVFTRVATARLLVVPVWIATMTIGLIVISRLSAIDALSVVLVALASIAASLSIPVLAWLRGQMRFGRAASATLIGRWVTTGLVLILLAVGSGGGTISSLLAANVIGEATILCIAVILVATQSGTERSDGSWDPRALSLRRALPFAANTVLGIAYNRLDVILVAFLTTSSQLAAYVPASRFQDALYLLPTALSMVCLPYLARLLGPRSALGESRAFLSRVWRIGLFVAIPGAFALILIMPNIIQAVLGTAYLPSVTPARILTFTIVIATVGAPVLALLVAAGRGAATTKAFGAAFGVSLTLHFALDWWLGATGAAIASLARDVANLGVAAWFARDLLWGRPFTGPTERPARDRAEPGVADMADTVATRPGVPEATMDPGNVPRRAPLDGGGGGLDRT